MKIKNTKESVRDLKKLVLASLDEVVEVLSDDKSKSILVSRSKALAYNHIVFNGNGIRSIFFTCDIKNTQIVLPILPNYIDYNIGQNKAELYFALNDVLKTPQDEVLYHRFKFYTLFLLDNVNVDINNSFADLFHHHNPFAIIDGTKIHSTTPLDLHQIDFRIFYQLLIKKFYKLIENDLMKFNNKIKLINLFLCVEHKYQLKQIPTKQYLKILHNLKIKLILLLGDDKNSNSFFENQIVYKDIISSSLDEVKTKYNHYTKYRKSRAKKYDKNSFIFLYAFDKVFKEYIDKREYKPTTIKQSIKKGNRAKKNLIKTKIKIVSRYIKKHKIKPTQKNIYKVSKELFNLGLSRPYCRKISLSLKG